MSKEKIPVYDLETLKARALDPSDFMIESFSHYLVRQSPHLHHPHRHLFYHLVCFTGGGGSHSIDFTRFLVEPGQIYFLNNRWILHNRTAFEDDPEPGRRRHLVRLWLAAPCAPIVG